MKYGHFDEAKKEYVIDRPDTPAPWANYLGSPAYGAIISNNAGGYSFEKSGANGRIIRYIFNSFDQPGRYVYLRDDDTSDFWSASWQPVGKSLNEYKSECHHGTAYTNIMADYSGIHSEVLYYVPLDKTHEVWNVTLTNKSNKTRHLSAIGFCEFTNDCNYEQDQVNLQYTLFISRTYYRDQKILQVINENVVNDSVDGNAVNKRFFGLAGSEVASYCGDKEEFLGMYHTYADPVAVINGDCGNKLNYNENSCGALQTKITLEPGESKTFSFILGMKDEATANEIMKAYEDEKTCAAELQELIDYWHGKLDNFQVKTPSESFNNMINTWNSYQCFMTFIWSRAASFTYCGLRNGYGYRDTVQDIQGIIHLAPEMALEKIRFMLSAQVDNGGGLPLVRFDHEERAGHEGTPDDPDYVRETGHPAYRADDALWLFPTVYKYISETGNLDFMDEEITWSNIEKKATVYEHLQKAIDFSMNHLGPHGLPAGLQNGIFQVANLFIQAGVNTFDATMVAGNSAAANADALLYDSMAAFYTACGSFMGQNYGAGKRKRVRNSYLVSLAYSFGIGTIGGIALVIFGRQFLGLFTNDPAVVDAGMKRLTIMGFSYGFSAFMDSAIAASRALGKSVIPTVIVIIGSCIFRMVWVNTVFAYFKTIPSLYLLYIFSWGITAVVEIIYWVHVYRNTKIG